MFWEDKPDFKGCDNEKLNFGVFDPVKHKRSFEEATVCALLQIRNLLAKIAYSVAPSIDKSIAVEVPSDRFTKVYSATSEVVVEVQNISNLSDTPNDLIIQPSFLKVKDKKLAQKLGIVVKPSDKIRLHLNSGVSIFARFFTDPSYIIISELNF